MSNKMMKLQSRQIWKKKKKKRREREREVFVQFLSDAQNSFFKKNKKKIMFYSN